MYHVRSTQYGVSGTGRICVPHAHYGQAGTLALRIMLNLHTPTPTRWLQQVENHIDLLLIDHAHCEKKAAGVAMNLLFSYVEHSDLTKAMTEIVQEELDHFHQVRAILDRR